MTDNEFIVVDGVKYKLLTKAQTDYLFPKPITRKITVMKS